MMEHITNQVFTLIESGGLFSPLLFIFFHIFRSIIFVPVAIICIAGGVLFGTIPGILYSVIGITLCSILFYKVIKWMPRTAKRLKRMKQRLVGKHTTFTIPQVTVLR